MSEEFIDTYSDDLDYLIEARKALLTHPFRTEVKELCDASFCRLFIVFMVDGIEAMIQYWNEAISPGVFYSYLKSSSKNSERIQNLYEVLNKYGGVDQSILEDYLALKYLRNVIVRAKWRPHEKEWVEKRGFPSDTRKLSEEHWYKVLEVYQNMMMYIAASSPALMRRKIPVGETIRIKIRREELKPIIIKQEDLPFIIFKNLGNIASEIYRSIEIAATSEDYAWARNYSPDDHIKISQEEAITLFYLSAKKAARDGFEEIHKHKELILEALFFWELYKQLTFTKNDIHEEEIKRCLEVLLKLHEMKCYPPPLPIPWNEKLPSEVKSQLVKLIKCESKDGEPSDTEIIRSLDIGKKVYKFMPDMTPVSLFMLYLPIIDPIAAKACIDNIRFIFTAWKLRETWYTYIEKHKEPNVSKWNFYERLFNELIK